MIDNANFVVLVFLMCLSTIFTFIGYVVVILE